MKKIHRFIGMIVIEGIVARLIDEDIARQAKSVLKLSAGEVISLCDGKGHSWTGPIQGISKDTIEIEIEGSFDGGDGFVRDVTVYLAMLKSDHFDFALQKAVECGAQRIVPIISRRTIKLQLKPERAQRIIREATEQSGRLVVPELLDARSFLQGLEHWKISGTPGIFFDVEGRPMQSLPQTQAISCFIGPEGGWDEEEIQAAKQSGLQPTNLGPIVLRAETAVTVATFLLSHHL